MSSIRSSLAALALATLSHAALAAPVPLHGTLSADDPTYNRTLSGSPPSLLSSVGTAVSYDVFQFHVTADGSYLMETQTASFSGGTEDDTFLSLYETSFDPTQALLNVLAADDDGGAGFLSSLTQTLHAGVNYFLVVTSFGNSQFGDYTARLDTLSGDGQIVLAPVDVPEPATLMLATAALAGLGFTRRRRNAA